MAYEIEFDKRVSKDLKKLDPAMQKVILNRCYSTLRDSPQHGSNIEPLRYLGPNIYRLKIERVWCVAYRVEQTKVYIVRIGHRREFYETLRERLVE